MTISYPSVSAAEHVPPKSAQEFIAMHYSLSWSLENLKSGTASLVYNKKIDRNEILRIYETQISAIKTLLTDNRLKEFWIKCNDITSATFYRAWQQAFNDTATKPRIDKTEKRIKLQQAKGHVQALVDLMDSDPSLQREIGIAVTQAVNHQWHQTRHVGPESWETLEIHSAEVFLRMLIEEINEISQPDAWQSTHALYPTKVNEKTAVPQIFINVLTPAIYAVYGKDKHKSVSYIMGILFPDLNIKPDTLRDAKRDKKSKK